MKSYDHHQEKAVKDQFEIYGHSERLLENLRLDGSPPVKAAALKSMLGCGSNASSTVEFIRGTDAVGSPFGTITGIQKCGNQACPYCSPELAAAERERLQLRFWAMQQSGEIEGTISYSASFTAEHHGGEDLEGVFKLLKGAMNEFHRIPVVSRAIAGGVFAIECTTGKRNGNGAHPHIQLLYTLWGTDEVEHEMILELAESVFRDYFRAHSVEVLGVPRRVSWRRRWFKVHSYGTQGFYGTWNPDWTPIDEITGGFAKNGGLFSTLTPGEVAEFYMAQQGKRWLVAIGCWSDSGEPPKPRESRVIATIEADQWNRIDPKAKRIIRTVVMDTKHWSDEEVAEYAVIANRQGQELHLRSDIQMKFRMDSLKLRVIAASGNPDLFKESSTGEE